MDSPQSTQGLRYDLMEQPNPRKAATGDIAPSRTSYDNIKRWKIVREPDSYAILPAPYYVFWVLAIVLPGVAAFYWLLHFGLEVDNRKALLIADMILLATSLLLLIICLRSWFQVSRDLRPFLVVRISQRELVLPRSEKTYPLDGNESFFIAHDYFDSGNDSDASELNFIDLAEEPATRTLLLHFIDRCRYFDKIGEELALLGVPFQLREHRDQ